MKRTESARFQTGLSLVDLMIGLGLGLLSVLAATALMTSNLQLSRTKSDNALLHEQTTMAIAGLSYQIKQSGYGDINREKGTKYENPTNLSADLPPLRGCVYGFTDPDAGDFSCSDATSKSAGFAAFSLAQVLSDTVDANLGLGVDCLGQAVPLNPSTGMREVLNHYYVQGTQLFCRATVPNLANAPADYPYPGRPILSGVVAFDVRYGQDTQDTQPSGNWARSGNADVIEAAGFDEVTAWRRVSWAQICVVVQSENDGRSTTAMQYIDCGEKLVKAPDLRIYRVFTERIALRNALQ
jgi:Tfp pilus assembly protein PilW